MAQITITIPDAILSRVLDAFAGQYGWQATIRTAEDMVSGAPGTPNPVSKAQFAKQQLMKFITRTVSTYESNAAVSAATASVEQDIVLS